MAHLTAVVISLSHGVADGVNLWLPPCVAIVAVWMMACVGAGSAHDAVAAPMHRALALGLLAAGMISAVLGLLQYYGLAEPLVPWTTAPESGQAYGNLRQRNQFGTLLNMALIAALWSYGELKGPGRRWLLGAVVCWSRPWPHRPRARRFSCCSSRYA